MSMDSHGRVGHRPGYLFDTNRELADEAARAYDERNERKRNAWRDKGEQQDEEIPSNDGKNIPRTRDPDQLRQSAEEAWQARNQRKANAWRQRTP